MFVQHPLRCYQTLGVARLLAAIVESCSIFVGSALILVEDRGASQKRDAAMQSCHMRSQSNDVVHGEVLHKGAGRIAPCLHKESE